MRRRKIDAQRIELVLQRVRSIVWLGVEISDGSLRRPVTRDDRGVLRRRVYL